MHRLKELPANHAKRSAILAELIAPVSADMERSEKVLARQLTSPYAFIQTLVRHIERFRGKRLRPVLLHLAAHAFGGEAPLAAEVAALVEMMHLATLCHDDILDEADTRRRVPTVNAEWDNKTAVMTGDMLFSRTFENLGKLDDPRPYRILGRTARQICEGELLQIASRFNTRMEEEDYYELVRKKTGALFGAAGQLGALLAGAGEEEGRKLHAYGLRMGVAFQIVDDCLDLMGVEATVGKSLGSDLKNGEPTLPLIHLFATAAQPQKRELLRLFRPDNGEITRQALRPFLERNGCVEYALRAAREEILRARGEIEWLPPSAAKNALLGLPGYILARQA